LNIRILILCLLSTLLWQEVGYAQKIPIVKLSQLNEVQQVDTGAVVYAWKNGRIGQPLMRDKEGDVAVNGCVFRFAVQNDIGADTTIYFRGATNRSVLLQLYNAVGKLISRQETGYDVPINKQFGQDGAYFLPLTIGAGHTLQAQVYIRGYFGPYASPASYLYTRTAYLQAYRDEAAYNNTQDFIVVFFTAATLMLLLFFWFMYLESRQPLYGRYALYLTLQWAYGMLKLGPATLVGYGLLHIPVVRFMLVEPFVLAAIGAYAWFVNELLNSKYQNPRLYQVLRWMAYILWGYSVVFTIASFLFPDMPFRPAAWSWMRLVLLPVDFGILIYIAIRVKSSVKGYYLTGNFLFLFFTVLAGVRSVGLIGGPNSYTARFNITDWYMIGILLESLFFAFALGIRIKELQKTKERSDERLIEQMQVTEKIIKENNTQLEQKVKERTEEVQRQKDELAEVRLQETRAAYEKQLSESRMQALRSRMNPHFIFNSLNSIKYFILKKENDTAEFYLNKFSRLLRLILDYTNHESITLQQELEALNVYLEIESVRFDKSFHYHIHVDESVDTERIWVPPLLLQPFVENAIWHGLANSEKDEKYCHIDIVRHEEHVLMQITDNGVGRAEAGRINANKPSRHTSYGLKITEDRISLFNNTNQGLLSIRVQDNMDAGGTPAGTTVNITFKTT
jgi:hypothetical protein